MHHTLKTWPQYFALSWAGLKPFEIRMNDRPYSVGDTLLLSEYYPAYDLFSGRMLEVVVEHIIIDAIGIKEGYVVLFVREKDRLDLSEQKKKSDAKKGAKA